MASSCNDLVAQYHCTEGACVHSSSPFARQPNFGTTETTDGIDLRTASSRRHGQLHLPSRRPAGTGRRPLPSPRPSGPAAEGGALAQEPRPQPRRHRHRRRCLPSQRPTLPGRGPQGGLPRLRRCPGHHPRGALVEHETSLEETSRRPPAPPSRPGRASSSGPASAGASARSATSSRTGSGGAAPGRGDPRPPKKTSEEHAQEQATCVQEELEPRLEQARRGQRQVAFVHAAHFGRLFLGCSGCAGCSCGRPRVASGTTFWGLWTR